MADKYPNISPYAYCAWNSVKLVDPDGNWPWEPKHIREARKCAHLNNGSINIERLKSGVKIANVGYFSVSSEYGKVFTIKSFTPKGYNSRGSIKKTTGLVDFELWMGESSENVGDFAIKQACIMGYSILNEPFEAIIGRSLAGSDINTDERLVAMISTLSSGFGKILSKGTGIIKTQGIDGLQKYNDFVKKSGGRNGRNQTEMGLLYQRNKQSLIDYSQGEKSYNIITSVLSVIKESKKND